MTKRHFIALADVLKRDKPALHGNTLMPVTASDHTERGRLIQWETTVEFMADYLESAYERFNRTLWLAYIAGECGPSGGKIK